MPVTCLANVIPLAYKLEAHMVIHAIQSSLDFQK